METAANPAFDVALIIGELHLFSVPTTQHRNSAYRVEGLFFTIFNLWEREQIQFANAKQALGHQRELESAQILGNDVTGKIRILQFSIKLHMRYC